MKQLLEKFAWWLLRRKSVRGAYVRFGEVPTRTPLGPNGQTGSYWAMTVLVMSERGMTSVCVRGKSAVEVLEKVNELAKRETARPE